MGGTCSKPVGADVPLESRPDPRGIIQHNGQEWYIGTNGPCGARKLGDTINKTVLAVCIVAVTAFALVTHGMLSGALACAASTCLACLAFASTMVWSPGAQIATHFVDEPKIKQRDLPGYAADGENWVW